MAAQEWDQGEAIAHVRVRRQSSSKYDIEGESTVLGPSGRVYHFGEDYYKSGGSQWIPIYPQHREDLDLFRQYEEFEVEERPDE